MLTFSGFVSADPVCWFYASSVLPTVRSWARPLRGRPDDADVAFNRDPRAERLGQLLQPLQDPLCDLGRRRHRQPAPRQGAVVPGPDGIDPDLLKLPPLEPAQRDRALVVDRLDDASAFEAAHDVFGLRGVAVRAEVAVAAPVPLAEKLAQVVENRLAFVDLDAAQHMWAVAHERVCAVVDRGMRELDQEVRWMVLEEERLQDRVALVRVNRRNHEVRVLLAVLDAAQVVLEIAGVHRVRQLARL